MTLTSFAYNILRILSKSSVCHRRRQVLPLPCCLRFCKERLAPREKWSTPLIKKKYRSVPAAVVYVRTKRWTQRNEYACMRTMRWRCERSAPGSRGRAPRRRLVGRSDRVCPTESSTTLARRGCLRKSKRGRHATSTEAQIMQKQSMLGNEPQQRTTRKKVLLYGARDTRRRPGHAI